MSNLDRIWELYKAYKKTGDMKEWSLSSWDYYREGYKEAQAQRAALDARRVIKKEECCGNPFKCMGNCHG